MCWIKRETKDHNFDSETYGVKTKRSNQVLSETDIPVVYSLTKEDKQREPEDRGNYEEVVRRREGRV